MVVVSNASVGGMTKPRAKPVSIETYGGAAQRAGDGRPTAKQPDNLLSHNGLLAS